MFKFIVNRGGEVGLTYEHSPAEGQPIAVMTDYVVDFMYVPNTYFEILNLFFIIICSFHCSENKYEDVDTNTLRNFPVKYKKLDVTLPKELHEYVRQAEIHLDE